MSAAKPLLWPKHEQGADRQLENAHEGNRIQPKAGTKIPHGATGRSAASPSAPSTSGTWTSARVEQLTACIKAGYSCSQIAVEIGVTRNAVIGKMNRLGLSRPRVDLAREPERKRDAWRPRTLTQHQILMDLPPEPASPEEAISLSSGPGCSLLELSPGKCRWPLSEPGTEAFCFCGNRQVEGLPYCVGHARIAYKSAARTRVPVRP
ncbi:MAG TPA: GcrA family cell cycle regulator [Xanthobacteraceae bacterium]|jgi:GcrA cell cycle regulator